MNCPDCETTMIITYCDEGEGVKYECPKCTKVVWR